MLNKLNWKHKLLTLGVNSLTFGVLWYVNTLDADSSFDDDNSSWKSSKIVGSTAGLGSLDWVLDVGVEGDCDEVGVNEGPLSLLDASSLSNLIELVNA